MTRRRSVSSNSERTLSAWMGIHLQVIYKHARASRSRRSFGTCRARRDLAMHYPGTGDTHGMSRRRTILRMTRARARRFKPIIKIIITVRVRREFLSRSSPNVWVKIFPNTQVGYVDYKRRRQRLCIKKRNLFYRSKISLFSHIRRNNESSLSRPISHFRKRRERQKER